jgi:hypothetical protein
MPMAKPSKSLIHSSESHPWEDAISSKYLEYVRNISIYSDICNRFRKSWPFTKKGIARWTQCKSQMWYNWVKKAQLSRLWRVTRLLQKHKVLGDSQSIEKISF